MYDYEFKKIYSINRDAYDELFINEKDNSLIIFNYINSEIKIHDLKTGVVLKSGSILKSFSGKCRIICSYDGEIRIVINDYDRHFVSKIDRNNLNVVYKKDITNILGSGNATFSNYNFLAVNDNEFLYIKSDELYRADIENNLNIRSGLSNNAVPLNLIPYVNGNLFIGTKDKKLYKVSLKNNLNIIQEYSANKYYEFGEYPKVAFVDSFEKYMIVVFGYYTILYDMNTYVDIYSIDTRRNEKCSISLPYLCLTNKNLFIGSLDKKYGVVLKI